MLLLDVFGDAGRTWNIRTRVETGFDTASITKLFTAVATLQLEAVDEAVRNV